MAHNDALGLDDAGMSVTWWLEWALADPSFQTKHAQFRRKAEKLLRFLVEFLRIDNTFLCSNETIADELGCSVRSVSTYRGFWISLGWLSRVEDGSLPEHRIDPERAVIAAAGADADVARGAVEVLSIPREVEAAAAGRRCRITPPRYKTCRPPKESEFSSYRDHATPRKAQPSFTPMPLHEPVPMGQRRRAAKTLAQMVLFLRSTPIPDLIHVLARVWNAGATPEDADWLLANPRTDLTLDTNGIIHGAAAADWRFGTHFTADGTLHPESRHQMPSVRKRREKQASESRTARQAAERAEAERYWQNPPTLSAEVSGWLAENRKRNARRAEPPKAQPRVLDHAAARLAEAQARQEREREREQERQRQLAEWEANRDAELQPLREAADKRQREQAARVAAHRLRQQRAMEREQAMFDDPDSEVRELAYPRHDRPASLRIVG